MTRRWKNWSSLASACGRDLQDMTEIMCFSLMQVRKQRNIFVYFLLIHCVSSDVSSIFIFHRESVINFITTRNDLKWRKNAFWRNLQNVCNESDYRKGINCSGHAAVAAAAAAAAAPKWKTIRQLNSFNFHFLSRSRSLVYISCFSSMRGGA